MQNHKLIVITTTLAAILCLGSLMAYKHQATTATTKASINSLDLSAFQHVKDLDNRVSQFRSWTLKHNKQYTPTEANIRFGAWNHNYDIVESHNSKNLSWTLAMNKFADLAREEYAALHLGFNPSTIKNEHKNEVHLDTLNIPRTFDWRNQGAVGSIKNQGQCGACWAFASCAALEGLYVIKGQGSVPDFSPQQLIDCSGQYGNNGCNGGTMVAAYQYARDNGIESEDSYPFQGQQGSCNYNSGSVSYNINGYNSVPTNNELQLKAAVASQPVTVAVEADQSVFQLYNGGVITSDCGTNLDHAITAVGYDTYSDGTIYWIVKNQWGADWGNNGYVYIARGYQNDYAGVCGINQMASYPTA